MVQMPEDQPSRISSVLPVAVLGTKPRSLGLHDSPLSNLNSLCNRLTVLTNVCCMFVSVCVYAPAMARGLRSEDNFVELVFFFHFCLGSGT